MPTMRFLTPSVHISKRSSIPYDASSKGGRRKNVTANGVQKCSVCKNKRVGVVIVEDMFGGNLHNNETTTLMTLSVGEEMKPSEVTGLDFSLGFQGVGDLGELGARGAETFMLLPTVDANCFEANLKVGGDNLEVNITTSLLAE